MNRMPDEDFVMLVREMENAIFLAQSSAPRELAHAAAKVAREYIDSVLALLGNPE